MAACNFKHVQIESLLKRIRKTDSVGPGNACSNSDRCLSSEEGTVEETAARMHELCFRGKRQKTTAVACTEKIEVLSLKTSGCQWGLPGRICVT